MAIDGFRVNLGKPAKGADLKGMVTEAALKTLLEQARQDPRFETAKGEYEFRLRKSGGEAVLELRRPTTGFFAKIWGGGRRAAERTAAHEALRRQLPELAERRADAGRMRKAEARAIASEAMTVERNREVHRDIVKSWHSAQKAFDSFIPAEGDKPAIAIPMPHVFAADFITRSVVSMKNGKLALSLEDSPGNDHAAMKARLDTVESFVDRALDGVEDKDGTARDALKKNLLSFVMQGNAVFHIENINKALVSESVATVNAGQQTFEFDLSIAGGRVVIEQRFESRDGLGMRTDVRNAVPNIRLPEYKSTLVFALPVSELIRNDFDPASAQVVSADWGMAPA